MRGAQPQRLHHDILRSVDLPYAIGPRRLHHIRLDGVRRIRIQALWPGRHRLCPSGWRRGQGERRGRTSDAWIPAWFAGLLPGRRRGLGPALLLVDRVEVGACGVQGVQHRLEGVLYLLREIRTWTVSSPRFGVVESHRQSSSTNVRGMSCRGQASDVFHGRIRTKTLDGGRRGGSVTERRAGRVGLRWVVVRRYAARAALSQPDLRDVAHISLIPRGVDACGSPPSADADADKMSSVQSLVTEAITTANDSSGCSTPGGERSRLGRAVTVGSDAEA